MSKNNEQENAENWIKILFSRLFKNATENKGFTKTFPAIIYAVAENGLTADIYLPADSSKIIPDVKLRNNVAVSVGNTVFVTAINRNMSNLFIDFNASMASSGNGNGTIKDAFNTGLSGIGFFQNATGDVLDFKNIDTTDSNISITDNITNNTVDISFSNTPTFTLVNVQNGATGSFTTVDSKTVTVTNGIITNIV